MVFMTCCDDLELMTCVRVVFVIDRIRTGRVKAVAGRRATAAHCNGLTSSFGVIGWGANPDEKVAYSSRNLVPYDD